MSLPHKTKSNKLHGHKDVNTAGTWDKRKQKTLLWQGLAAKR
jgi:hypothetical protein